MWLELKTIIIQPNDSDDEDMGLGDIEEIASVVFDLNEIQHFFKSYIQYQNEDRDSVCIVFKDGNKLYTLINIEDFKQIFSKFSNAHIYNPINIS